MGSHNRTNPRIKDGGLQDISIKPRRTKTIGRIPPRTTRNGKDKTKQITHGITLLLCQEKRWKVTTGTGLSKTKRNDHKEQIPFTAHFRISRSTIRSEVLLKNGCTMGIQQYQDKRRRRMESRLPNKSRPVRTPGYVLRINQLSGNIPNNDE